MTQINRAKAKAQTATALDATDQKLVYDIALSQRWVWDKYDVDGVTILTAAQQVTTAIAALSVQNVRIILTWLDQLDSAGPDTFRKSGGTDGVNFDPTRDADVAEKAICRVLFNTPDPITGAGPFFA